MLAQQVDPPQSAACNLSSIINMPQSTLLVLVT
jgi:hypothetical protein